MPLVSKPACSACRAERLARAASGPNFAVISETRPSEGVRPDSNAREHMDLGETDKFFGSDVTDISFVDNARRDLAGGD